MLQCEVCGIEIPASNMLMHSLKCSRKQALPAAAAAALPPQNNTAHSAPTPLSELRQQCLALNLKYLFADPEEVLVAKLREARESGAGSNSSEPSGVVSPVVIPDAALAAAAASEVAASAAAAEAAEEAAAATTAAEAVAARVAAQAAAARAAATSTAASSHPPQKSISSPPIHPDALRCRVSSEVEELQLLHEVYGWVPGRANVRPKPDVRAQKELLLANLDKMWATPADWVFHHVFAAATTRGPDGKRAVTARPDDGRTIFKPNPFPYDVPAGTEHWVFWMASPEGDWPEQRIQDGLGEAVDALGGGDYGALA